MAFRKLQADRIFDGRTFQTGQVLVVNEQGRVMAMLPQADAGSEVEVMKGTLSPGFVNSHCHLELSHMKGLIPENTGLVDFVCRVVGERNFPAEVITKAIEDAEEEMWRNGIVAVGDICNNTTTCIQKEKRRLLYYNFIEASGWLPSIAPARMERALGIYDRFLQLNQPCSIVPHAPYSVSAQLWEELKPHFKNKSISIHNQEASFEDELFREGTGDFLRLYRQLSIDHSHHQPSGVSSLQSYYKHLLRARRALLVHNTFTKQEDLDYIRQTGLSVQDNESFIPYFCICINANLYIEDALPPLELFRQNHFQLVLGTDSLASNHSLDIMSEIRTIHRYFPAIPLDEILRWATLNGAQALDMDDRLGSFEKGKTPGVLLINEEDLSVHRLI